MMILASAYAWAADRQVGVCVPPTADATVNRAKPVAGRIFAEIGVEIEWKQFKHCAARELRLQWSMETSPQDHPGAMAYAQPFEGTVIVVFLDRIRLAGNRKAPVLLGHVLAHEIGHMLQGSNRGRTDESKFHQRRHLRDAA